MEIKTRESNFELLRIVTMLFIVLHHFIVHGLQTAGYAMYDTKPTNAGIFANSFFVIGVNVFILISGYFGIRQSWKGFVRLFAFCTFYELLFVLVSEDITQIKPFLPFSNSSYWFIADYFFLWLLSPVLNWIIEILKNDKKKFVFLLGIAGIFIFYFGWFYYGKYSGGYNLWNFMFLYFIGRFIALHTREIRSTKSIYLSIYEYINCHICKNYACSRI